MIYVILAYITYPVVFLISRLVGQAPNSILVFQTAKIGDMICTTPVFREIKKAFPSIRLGVVVTPSIAPILRFNPHIDEIIEFDKKQQRGLIGKFSFAYRIYRLGYGTALILMPNLTNILSAFWALIPRRVSIYPNFTGITLKLSMGLNTHIERHIPSRMSMETFIESLKHIGIKGGKTDKEVYSSPDADLKAEELLEGKGPFIGIMLGTGNSLKDWGEENFIMLARRMLDDIPSQLVLLGSEKERETAEEIIMRCINHKKRVLSLCGKCKLVELPAVMKRLALVIGVDTGLIYMADSLGVPVINIAGPCNMNDQRPTGKRSVIVQKIELECLPCSHTFFTPYECKEGHRKCVTEVKVEEVFESATSSFS